MNNSKKILIPALVVSVIFIVTMIFLVTKQFKSVDEKELFLENKRYTYISLGDSLAAGVDPNLNLGTGFADYVAAHLNDEDKLEFYTKEFAISGYKTNNLINDIESNISKNLDGNMVTIQDTIQKSDIITLSIGANDFISELLKGENGRININSVDELSKINKETMLNIIDSIIPNIQKTVSIIKNYNKNANIILLGFYNPVPLLYQYNPQMVDEVFTYGNAKIDEIGQEEEIFVSHFYKEFRENSSAFLPNSLDIHPSLEGYKLMSYKIIDVIDNKIIKK